MRGGRLAALNVVMTLVLALLLAGDVSAQKHSQYAGQDRRTIKSLSRNDIAELRRGGGWGFAKAAELNGFPGPLHLLELKDRIGLTSKQVAGITKIYNEMREVAVKLGQEFIAQEQELDRKFQDGSLDATKLDSLLQRIANVRARLRSVHLSAHLKVRPLISVSQVETYNKLRGYGQSDPCTQVPTGHNVAMWRKHNGCD